MKGCVIIQLYILDKDPIISAQRVPDKYKFKMLIELGQLICSAGISDAYKPIKQGQELQVWVDIYRPYTYIYFNELLCWSIYNIKLKPDTLNKLVKIRQDLEEVVYEHIYSEPTHAYFRYHKDYKCDVESKTLLQIDECIKYYEDYLINFKGVEL